MTTGTRTLTLAHEIRRYIQALEDQARDDGVQNRMSAAVVRNLVSRELREILGRHFDEGGR